MQPDLQREGYGIFVRCCDLTSETPVAEFVSTIETVDAILEQMGGNEDSFPSPYGVAIYRPQIDQALDAARAVAGGLAASGISAGIGVAWGRFQRTVNVQDWNTAAHPMNQAARLAFCDAAQGHVLVTPHVRDNAGARVKFSDQRDCEVKGTRYLFHAIESPGYVQTLAARSQAPGTPETCVTNIVLWDIVKYSTEDSDEQAELSHALAVATETVLQTFNAGKENYSPTGDGGFATFDTGLKAIAFAKRLGTYAASKGITIRTGINHGEVAFVKRGPIGPGVLRADKISAKAPPNGIAILADVWDNLDRISQEDWQPTEVPPDLFTLEAKPAIPPPVHAALTARELRILVDALSDIPQFLSVRDRQAFIRMVLSEHPFGDEAYRTLRQFLDWQGGAFVVADNLVHLLEAQELAPGLPALRVIAEAIEPFAGMAHREGLAGLRRRL